MRLRRSEWNHWAVGLASTAGVAAVGYFDYLSGPDLSFSLFYLLPIGVAAWFGRRGMGLGAAMLSAVMWWYVDQLSGPLSGPLSDATLIPLWNALIRFGTFVVVVLLMRALRRQLTLVTHLARTDALTGLVARSRFLELLEGEVLRVRRLGHPLSVAYLDVDDFKQVNDTFGHVEGDRLLRTVAETMQESTRNIDLAARLGGDEFMLLMPETTPENARKLLARLESDLGQAVGERWNVTFSIGLLTFLTPPANAKEAVREVDHLMYAVKHNGKNGVAQRVVTSSEPTSKWDSVGDAPRG